MINKQNLVRRKRLATVKIIELRALRGPNFFHQLPVILMKLDIGKLEECPTNTVANFKESIHDMMPTLYDHTCSPGVRGGFYQRLDGGTWPGHVVEHVAIELQCLIGHNVSFGKTYTMSPPGNYTVVFRYLNESVGLQAAKMAVNIIDNLYQGIQTEIDPLLEELKTISIKTKFGPSTQSIVDEAIKRGIPVIRLNEYSYVQLGYGKNQRRIEATLMDNTSALGLEISGDKDRTKSILELNGIPTATGQVVSNLQDAIDLANDLHYPVVVKPINGNHGRGVTTNINSDLELRKAYKRAQKISDDIIIEKFLIGNDYRVMVIDGKYVACALREPAHVIGSGKHTIEDLIKRLNQDPKRGEGHDNVLTKVSIDDETEDMIQNQGYELQSIPLKGMKVTLKSTANVSSGGTAIDITDKVDPYNKFLAERISNIIGLNVMGIDIISPSLEQPIEKGKGGVIEVNAGPGFRMHLSPSKGQSRNIPAAVVDMLFPKGSEAKIPICAVTGTNGKTTTARLISHILKQSGNVVGTTSTEGVKIDNIQILSGDYSGPEGATTVLKDKMVDHAVLEVARGGLARRGLAFDVCDVGVLLNVSNDHLGMDGIETLDDLARLKGTVTASVTEQGYAVFNADDDYVMSQVPFTKGNIVLFSMNYDNPFLTENLAKGNVNICIKDNEIVIQRPYGTVDLAIVKEIPITYCGLADFNVQNVMAAAGACLGLGLDEIQIKSGLLSFNPTISQSKGRMNLIDMGDFKVIIDYGHNPHAILSTGKFLSSLSPGRTIRMTSGAGNRRDEELIAFGEAIAQFYDYVIITDPDPRQRQLGETANRVAKGCMQGDMGKNQYELVYNEIDAAEICLDMAKPGDLVVLQADDIDKIINCVINYKNKLHS